MQIVSLEYNLQEVSILLYPRHTKNAKGVYIFRPFR